MNILIAEDDVVSRKMMIKILSDFGDCDFVVNGMEAIDAYLLAQKENKIYDLIFLDIMMPKIDGIKALKTIRELEKQNHVMKPAKIIMITALNEKDVVEDAYKKGADAYATKPLDINKLVELIKKFEFIDR